MKRSHSQYRFTKIALLLLVMSALVFAVDSSAESLLGSVKSVDTAKKELVLDVGKDNGVKAGDKFRIFACNSFVVLPFSNEKHVLEIHGAIAELTLKTVELKSSTGSYVLVRDEYAKLVEIGCIAEKIEIDSDSNKIPLIKNLLSKGTKLFPGSVTTLTVDYSDQDGDVPVFEWSAPGCSFHFSTTHYPVNRLYIPVNYASKTVTVSVTADDKKGQNSKDTKEFTLQVSEKPPADYYNSKYDSVRVFPQMLLGDKFNVDDVGVLANGSIVLLDKTRQRALFYFDAHMRFQKKMEDFRRARDLLTYGDLVYVLEDNQVVVLNSSGEKVTGFTFDNRDLNSFIGDARRIGVKRNGDMMIVDGTTRQIKIFDKKGNYRISIGMAGQHLGGFLEPCAIVEDRFGNIYVLDTSRKDIQIFNDKYDLAGAPISLASLAGPVDLVYDDVLHKLFVLDTNGRILTINAAKTDERTLLEPKSGTFMRFTRSPANTYYITSNGGTVLQRYIPGVGTAWYNDDNFYEISSLSCDSVGNTYLLAKRFANGMIRVVDRDGWYFQSMAPQDASEYGKIRDANDIRVSPDGKKIYLLDSYKRVIEFNGAAKYVANYEFEDSVTDIAVDGVGNMYALLGKRGDIYICSGGANKFYCGIQDKKISSKCVCIASMFDGSGIFIANTKDNKIFQFSQGNFKEPFPAGRSDFRALTRLVTTSIGVLFVLDDNRDVITPLYAGPSGMVSGGEIQAKDVSSISVNGNGDIVMLGRSDLRIMRLPFLQNE